MEKMGMLRLLVGGIFLALCLPMPTAAAPMVLGFLPAGSTPADLQASRGSITALAIDNFRAMATGEISGTASAEVLAFARRQRLQTFAVISNWGATDFSPAIAHAILTSPAATAQLIAEMKRLEQADKYDGIDIDFEEVAPSDRAKFSAFIAQVAGALHAQHRLLLISVPAEEGDKPGDDSTGAYDYAALGKLADLLQLMTYDRHGPWSEPGPVAPADWVERVARYAISVVPREKLNLGLPAYGYDWNITRGDCSEIAWNKIPDLLSHADDPPVVDQATASCHFTYFRAASPNDPDYDKGPPFYDHVVWYENGDAVTRKVRLATQLGLAGVSVWALWMEDASFWHAVRAGAK